MTLLTFPSVSDTRSSSLPAVPCGKNGVVSGPAQGSLLGYVKDSTGQGPLPGSLDCLSPWPTLHVSWLVLTSSGGKKVKPPKENPKEERAVLAPGLHSEASKALMHPLVLPLTPIPNCHMGAPHPIIPASVARDFTSNPRTSDRRRKALPSHSPLNSLVPEKPLRSGVLPRLRQR